MIRDELEKRYKEGERDFRGVRMPGADLSGIELAGADLSGANFRGASFREAVLDGAVFNRAILEGVDFQEAQLGRSDFRHARLSRANLFGAYLVDANFAKAHLSNANMVGARLHGSDLSGAFMSGVNLNWAYLTGANLTGAKLTGACLKRTDLTKAALINADLSWANLNNTSIKGAYLEGARLIGVKGLSQDKIKHYEKAANQDKYKEIRALTSEDNREIYEYAMRVSQELLTDLVTPSSAVRRDLEAQGIVIVNDWINVAPPSPMQRVRRNLEVQGIVTDDWQTTTDGAFTIGPSKHDIDEEKIVHSVVQILRREALDEWMNEQRKEFPTFDYEEAPMDDRPATVSVAGTPRAISIDGRSFDVAAEVLGESRAVQHYCGNCKNYQFLSQRCSHASGKKLRNRDQNDTCDNGRFAHFKEDGSNE